MPADEGNYTVNKLDTYNVYLLKKDVSSSGETAKQGYYRLNDEGTKIRSLYRKRTGTG